MQITVKTDYNLTANLTPFSNRHLFFMTSNFRAFTGQKMTIICLMMIIINQATISLS